MTWVALTVLWLVGALVMWRFLPHDDIPPWPLPELIAMAIFWPLTLMALGVCWLFVTIIWKLFMVDDWIDAWRRR